MAGILILQSAPPDRPGWVDSCLASVAEWAAESGYERRFVEDSLFDPVPGWYLSKVGRRTAIAADLARLLWIERVLDEGAEVGVWLDADVLMLPESGFEIEIAEGPVLGRELWLETEARKARIRKNVHNAFCAFRRDCRVLPFLVEATERIVRRVDPDFIAPQIVGPKLLTSLHNIVGFELEPRIGAISPELHRAIVARDERVLTRYRNALSAPLAGANLCGTLADGRDMEALIEALSEMN